MKLILALIAASILSTATMDICGGILRAAGITAGAPAGLVGKWLNSAMKGKVFLSDIRTSPGDPVPLPRVLLYHYTIGMILTLVLFSIVTVFNITPVPW